MAEEAPYLRVASAVFLLKAVELHSSSLVYFHIYHSEKSVPGFVNKFETYWIK